MLSEISTTVGSVTVRTGGGDAHAIRQSVSGQLSCAELTPIGLPPSAFLIVRQLRDPMPGRIQNAPDSPGIDNDWERAAVEHLSLVHERAARPEKGVIPADCEAIVFADEAEMLACLSIDLACGCVTHHWWWDLVAGHLPGGSTLAPSVGSLLHDNRDLVPATMDYISGWGRVESVLSELSADESLGVLSAMLDHFDLRELDQAIAQAVSATPLSEGTSIEAPPSTIGEEAFSSDSTDGQGVTEIGTSGLAVSRRLRPPWSPVVGPATSLSSLTPEQSLLLGIALTLQRAPAVLRRPPFRSEIARWWHAEVHIEEGRSEQPTSAAVAADDSPPDAGGSALADAEQIGLIEDGETPVASPTGGDTQQGPSSDDRGEDSDSAASSALSRAESEDDQDAEEHDILTSVESDMPFTGLDPIRTAFGGVFFLINLISVLGLPESCTRWRLGHHVGHWGLLEFLARKLLSAGAESHDPVWAVLAEFKKADSPGLTACRDDSTESRLPPEWSSRGAATGTTYGWSASRDRLRVWSSEGYLIANVARGDRPPSRQALEELRLHRPDCKPGDIRRKAIHAAPAAIAAAIDSDQFDDNLERWFAFVRPFLITLLRQQMNMPEAEPSTVVDELLKRAADLFVTKTHIDLIFNLESVSMAVRRAGLDCDPGWQPEFGRVIKFHYQ